MKKKTYYEVHWWNLHEAFVLHPKTARNVKKIYSKKRSEGWSVSVWRIQSTKSTFSQQLKEHTHAEIADLFEQGYP